jgi:hypothetical protein
MSCAQSGLSCELCKSRDPILVPPSWSKERLCTLCFPIHCPEATILTFEACRGGLQARWKTEGFLEHVVLAGDRMHVLATLLDQHHLLQIENESMTQLVEDYRTGLIIYEMDVKRFYDEIGWFYA